MSGFRMIQDESRFDIKGLLNRFGLLKMMPDEMG